ncbi:hypothetical protein [Chryseobacterium shigense]|uniref:Uncharacterized protein n=1 Tax=Chryseobacterium shigense TaxID=297244 RepID=A0A841NDB7_9FLAO|nr:hypothetical protein [Chryseobacterium shigense]MBB6371320.1 hypothetical protein [Chryseobacterium shigense]
MKTILFHSASVVISMVWLITEYQTWNPVSLRGPRFLKFYLILLVLFYTSFFILKKLKEQTSKATLFFMIFIFLTGIIKLIRGITLGKPVGFLLMILLAEIIVTCLYIFINRKYGSYYG